MITKPWTPHRAGPAPQTTGALHTGAMFRFIDNTGAPLELSLFSTLYAVVASLRTKLPCSVLLDQNEIFLFDGQGQPNTTEAFGDALTNFEFYLLREQHVGYDAALQWMQGVVAKGADTPGTPPAPEPAFAGAEPSRRQTEEPAQATGFETRSNTGERVDGQNSSRRHRGHGTDGATQRRR